MRILKYLMTSFFLPLAVFAGVNVKNGNFYISYTDIVVPGGGQDLKITRTYNSKSTDKGWFGMGWGSYYETSLHISPDGSVVIHENGSGAKTRFLPAKGSVDANKASDKIVEAMRKKSSGTMTDGAAKRWKDKFKKDAELRQAYARRYGVTVELPKGTTLTSAQRGPQTVVVLDKSFERRHNDGKVEVFNKSGKLIEVRSRGGYRVSLNYNNNSQGTLKSIKDSKGKQLFFDWHANGFVKKMWSTGGEKSGATYSYDANNLTQSRDTSGNVYKFSYDKNHNMTRISYSDKTAMTIKYDPKTQFAVEVVDKNNRKTGYKYESDPKKPDLHYWTTVTRQSPGGDPEENRYEYEIKIRRDGSRYNHRIATTIRGVNTETIYSECCNLPEKITRGKMTTKFEYNDDGLLLEKTSTTGEFTKLEYHKKFKKITKVTNNNGWTKFDYNPKSGLLSKGTNSTGETVTLFHDRKERIKRMMASNKNTKESSILNFKYNALDKPVEIKLEGVGKINVDYDNSGAIKKVDSKAGHKIALKVTQGFQSLLRIVRPAGVNLNI